MEVGGQGKTRIRLAMPEDQPGILGLERHFPSDRLSARALRGLLQSNSAMIWVALPPPSSTLHSPPSLSAALILLTRRNSRSARIYSLAVNPAARGQGLAKKLVQKAEAAARRRGCERLSLEVRADNAAARGLYAGLGYAELKRLPGYYDDGAPGLRLHRQLGPARR